MCDPIGPALPADSNATGGSKPPLQHLAQSYANGIPSNHLQGGAQVWSWLLQVSFFGVPMLRDQAVEKHQPRLTAHEVRRTLALEHKSTTFVLCIPLVHNFLFDKSIWHTQSQWSCFS